MVWQMSSGVDGGIGSAEVLPAAACAAVGALDQWQAGTDADMSDIIGPPVGVIPPRSVAQTFTAGLSGALTAVELFVGSNGSSDVEPVTVEIRETLAGAPGPTVLASAEIPAACVTPVARWVTVVFTDPATVRSTTQYAIIAHTGGHTVYLWYCGAPAAAASGALWETFDYPPAAGWDRATTDLAAFRTYVQTLRRPNPGAPTTVGALATRSRPRAFSRSSRLPRKRRR
jgi:hypothetical protein